MARKLKTDIKTTIKGLLARKGVPAEYLIDAGTNTLIFFWSRCYGTSIINFGKYLNKRKEKYI